MARNGTGTMVRLHDWSTDRDNGVKILAERMDEEDDGFATALTESIARDGQTTASARIPFNLGITLPAGTVTAPGWNVSGDSNTGWYAPGADNIAAACGGVKILDVLTTGVAITGTLSASGGFSGALTAADGTVGAPGIGFTSDLDNGAYRIGTNHWGLSVGGGLVVDLATTGVAITGTLSATGALTYGGVTLSNAVTGTGNMVLSASPTLTGTLTATTITPTTINAFTLGGTIAGGGNQINNVIIGNSTPLAGSFTAIVGTSSAIAGTETITSASATALTVGRLGATTPAFQVDASTATSITGFKIKSAASGGGLALSAVGETNVNVTLDAAGSGTIIIGGTSTGAITLTRATTLSAALTYGGVTLSNAVTGTGNMVLSASPTLSGTVGGALTFSGALTLSSALTYGGVTLTNAVTGTGKMVLDTSSTIAATAVTVGGNSVLTVAGNATLTGGFNATSFSAGTKSSGTFTPAPLSGNHQHYTNGGAHTLAPPASTCSMVIEITNNGSAGAITTSGFTKVDGDAFTTTNAHVFICYIAFTNGSKSHLNVKAMQ